jgi:hypothetical protein
VVGVVEVCGWVLWLELLGGFRGSKRAGFM